MAEPSTDKIREVPQPALLPVPDRSVRGVATPRDDHCVSDGVRDGAVITVISNVINLIIISQHFTLTL